MPAISRRSSASVDRLLPSGSRGNSTDRVSEDDKENVDTTKAKQLLAPSKPVSRHGSASQNQQAAALRHVIPSRPQRGPLNQAPPLDVTAHHKLELISGLRHVDSDNESDDELAAAPHHVNDAFRSGLASQQSSFKRSAAVSRQASDASVTAAGTAFQLLRGLGSASSTPAEGMWSRRTSRSNSLVSHPAALQQDGAIVSRTNSAARHTSISATPPEVQLHMKLAAKTMRLQEAQHSMEEEIARRHSKFAPENVLIRRWLLLTTVARSANALVCAGGLRVRAFNMQQRAMAILTMLFIPAWRLHCVRRRRKAHEVIQRFILRTVLRIRVRQRRHATDLIRHFLQNKMGMFQQYARWFSRCVKIIQRAFRAFRARRDAMVELNYRFARKFEEVYWTQAKTLAQDVAHSRFQAEIKSASAVRRASRVAQPTTMAVHADPIAIPKDFPTFTTLGRMPESILRKNLRPLVFKKSKDWFAETQRRTQQAIEQFKRVRRNSLSAMMLCPELSKRSVVVKLPPFRAFLTLEEIFSALDGSAITLAAMRDAPSIAFHLGNRGKTPVPSLESSSKWTELSELSLTSDRLYQSGCDFRTCSLSDIFGGDATKRN